MIYTNVASEFISFCTMLRVEAKIYIICLVHANIELYGCMSAGQACSKLPLLEHNFHSRVCFTAGTSREHESCAILPLHQVARFIHIKCLC